MTQSIDLNIDFDLPDRLESKEAEKPISMLVLVSIVAHILFVSVIAWFSGFNQTSEIITDKTSTTPIKATLYFPPPLEIIEEETFSEKAPPVEVAEEIIPEVVEELPAPETASVTEPLNEAPQNEAPPNETPPEPAIVKSNDISPPDAVETLANDTNSPVEQATNSGNGTRLERLNRALSSHLNQIQEERVSEMSQHAARNRDQIFYEQQTQGLKPGSEPETPDNGLDYTEAMLETGLEISAAAQSNLKPTNVDCSSTAGKVANTLSFFGGGRIKCTDKPDFQKYIDARLNKK